MISYPFVNQSGKRLVRWRGVMIMWATVTVGTLLSSCVVSYFLTGDWRFGAWLGLVLGVGYSTAATFLGFATSADKLPPAA